MLRSSGCAEIRIGLCCVAPVARGDLCGNSAACCGAPSRAAVSLVNGHFCVRTGSAAAAEPLADSFAEGCQR